MKETAMDRIPAGRLEELAETYPWFAGAHAALYRLDAERYPLPRWEALAMRYRLTLGASRRLAEQPAVPAGSRTPKPDTAGVIDRFIACGEHRIAPAPDTPDSLPGAEEEPGGALPDGMLSERLAEIYRRQGHTARAIEIYERLGLLNPKKSVYFAELIRRIREEAE